MNIKNRKYKRICKSFIKHTPWLTRWINNSFKKGVVTLKVYDLRKQSHVCVILDHYLAESGAFFIWYPNSYIKLLYLYTKPLNTTKLKYFELIDYYGIKNNRKELMVKDIGDHIKSINIICPYYSVVNIKLTQVLEGYSSL